MKTLISVRLDETDLDAMDSAARAAGMSQSQFIRAAIRAALGRRPQRRKPQPPPAPAPPSALTNEQAEDLRKLAAAINRVETLALAAAASAYESQIVARAGLTDEQAKKLKDHRIATIAAWRSWGVKAAYLGLDMRPKGAKHE
ncbi:MAG: ribbon-helix-helix domain-containing protein [Gammaproteobacteria bacterium]|nr:ribbon-helix-helix domain-containing protein [Gammaproteobacteria bacterium]